MSTTDQIGFISPYKYEGTEPPPITKLSNEIIYLVLKYLAYSRDDLEAVRKTCRNWNDLTKSGSFKKHLLENGPANSLQLSSNHILRLISLWKTQSPDADLTHLDLHCAPQDSLVGVFESIRSCCQKLTYLKVGEVCMRQFTGNETPLIDLYLSFVKATTSIRRIDTPCTTETFTFLESWKGIHSLEILHLSFPFTLAGKLEQTIQALSQPKLPFGNVKTITLSPFISYEEQHTRPYLSQHQFESGSYFSTINQVLSIKDKALSKESLPFSFYITILSSTPNIRELNLDLGIQDGIFFQALESLETLTSLESLTISNRGENFEKERIKKPTIDPAPLIRSSIRMSLKLLKIIDADLVDPDFKEWGLVSATFPHVTQLDFSSTNLTEKGFRILAQTFPSTEILCLKKCPNIIIASILQRWGEKTFPNLKKLEATQKKKG